MEEELYERPFAGSPAPVMLTVGLAVMTTNGTPVLPSERFTIVVVEA